MHDELICDFPNINFVGVDFSSNAISLASSNAVKPNFFCSDFISFLDAPPAFDIVVTQRSIMALMEAQEQDQLLKGIRRILQPDGVGIFQMLLINLIASIILEDHRV